MSYLKRLINYILRISILIDLSILYPWLFLYLNKSIAYCRVSLNIHRHDDATERERSMEIVPNISKYISSPRIKSGKKWTTMETLSYDEFIYSQSGSKRQTSRKHLTRSFSYFPVCETWIHRVAVKRWQTSSHGSIPSRVSLDDAIMQFVTEESIPRGIITRRAETRIPAELSASSTGRCLPPDGE